MACLLSVSWHPCNITESAAGACVYADSVEDICHYWRLCVDGVGEVCYNCHLFRCSDDVFCYYWHVGAVAQDGFSMAWCELTASF